MKVKYKVTSKIEPHRCRFVAELLEIVDIGITEQEVSNCITGLDKLGDDKNLSREARTAACDFTHNFAANGSISLPLKQL